MMENGPPLVYIIWSPRYEHGELFFPNRKIQSEKLAKKKEENIYIPSWSKNNKRSDYFRNTGSYFTKKCTNYDFFQLVFEIIYFPFYTIIANMLRLKPTPLLSTKCKNSSCKFSLIWKITLFRRNV